MVHLTFFWKYLVCGFKIEISEYPTKLFYVTYSPYKYELNRTKTHEDRANQKRPFFLSGHCRCVYCTVDGKKNRPSEFCSHFMSFYPIDFIFIGWVGYDMEYFRVPRNFDFKPTNPIFSPKRQMNHFRKWPFLGVWCRKLTFRENGVMDMANMLDSVLNRLYTTFPNIISVISAISADLSKSQKNHILEKFLCRQGECQKSTPSENFFKSSIKIEMSPLEW